MTTVVPKLTIFAANEAHVTIGALTICFSYSTPIAFDHPSLGVVVRENAWGPTTGKHLNRIDEGDKKSRLPRATFERVLEHAAAGRLKLAQQALAKAGRS